MRFWVLEFRVHTFVQAVILPLRSKGHMCRDMVVKHQMCRKDRCWGLRRSEEV